MLAAAFLTSALEAGASSWQCVALDTNAGYYRSQFRIRSNERAIFTLIVWTAQVQSHPCGREVVSGQPQATAGGRAGCHENSRHTTETLTLRRRIAPPRPRPPRAAPVRLSETAAPAVDAKPPKPIAARTSSHSSSASSRRRRFLFSFFFFFAMIFFANFFASRLRAFFLAFLRARLSSALPSSSSESSAAAAAAAARAAHSSRRRACPRGGRRRHHRRAGGAVAAFGTLREAPVVAVDGSDRERGTAGSGRPSAAAGAPRRRPSDLCALPARLTSREGHRLDAPSVV